MRFAIGTSLQRTAWGYLLAVASVLAPLAT